jgi:CHAD domain-containing protein
LFRPAVSDGDFARLREDVRWFTSQLGEARNLDVYLEGEVPKAERKALLQRREQAYDEVIGALNSTRLRLLMIDLLAWVTLGEWRSRKKASRPFAVFADRRIGRLWLRICGHDDLRRLDDEERHELRIEVKKLRYALDFIRALTPVADRRQKRFTAAIQGLQEALGRLNDIVVARQITGDPQGASDQRARAEERANCIREATRCFNRLKVTGPYWTRHHPAPAG